MLSAASVPAADAKHTNPLVFGNNRLTIVTPTLLRLEYAKDAKFIDEPTLFAIDRSNMVDPDDIAITETSPGIHEIRTDALRIEFEDDGFPFSTSNLRVYYTLNGKEKKFTNRFLPKNNLGGPVETLDRVTQEIPMNDGLLSTDGWYMIDDNQSDILVDGWIQPRDTNTHLQDQYCFIYGNDYKAALASLGAISGHVPMTRKYIHGVWYCRYWDYTADEFLDIVKGYDENDFPIDNLVMDMGWHTNDAAVGTGHNGHRNWNGYTWNRELIPDPKALIDAIHADGITVSLNDHPHDGIRPHEETYKDFMAELGLPEDGPVPLFDLSDSTYMKAFFKYAHKPSEDIGVDFWWLDWQQNYLYPKVRGHNSTSLSWINELYYRDSQRRNMRGAGYSRWAGWGDHRHPIQFSGDAQANWELLAFEVKLTSGSGNGGCYYWAHDTGGFRGAPNPELTARWTQFSALSAALRVHSTKDAKLDRRPWISGEKETASMRRMYHMRSQLMPYVYSTVWQVHNTMVPMNRGMYIEYADKEAFENPQQFLFGDLILAAPITSPGEGDNKVAAQKVWFPGGDCWYDFFTAERHEGGVTKSIAKPLDEFPMYVKGGWLLPMQPYTRRPATTPLTTLVMRVYPAGRNVDNSYPLYEDDGLTLDYEQGKYAITGLAYKEDGGNVTVTVGAPEGKGFEGKVNRRDYRLELGGLTSAPVNVRVNGKRAAADYDAQTGCYVIATKVMPTDKPTVIKYSLK